VIQRLALCGALVFACTEAAGAQPAPEHLLHTYSSVALSPDGTRVVSIDSSEAGENAVKLPPTKVVIRTVTSGAAIDVSCPVQVECRLSSPVWSPDGSRIAFLERVPKTDETSVWTVNADGSNAKPWLAGYKGVLGTPRWSPDGSALGLLATANALKETGATQAGAALVGEISAVKTNDVQRIAVLNADGTLQYASPPDLFVYEYDWMPNGSGFAATAAHGNGDDNWWVAKLYAIDAATAAATVVYAPPLQINAPKVSPDGKTVAFISGIMSDFGSVGGDIYTVPITGGAATDVTPNIPASPNAIDWRGRNDRITFTALAGDAATLETLDLTTKQTQVVWSTPASVYADQNLRVSLSADGSTGAALVQTFEKAPEIYAGPIGKWNALTQANASFVAHTKAQSVTWSNDGFQVQGWLLAPLNVVPGKKYPLMVQIHGGPSAAAGPRFVSDRGGDNQLLERGYFIFYPNPRGSYGQGERFTAANVRDFGYGDLRDILSGVDAVEKIAPIDDKRLAVGGFSYGGYMTMWAVTQTNRFRAAIAGAGIANYQSYYGQNGIDKWMLPFFGATVYDDPAVYARSSPITFIKNVKTPTFIFVGERDVECPMAQSLEFWHALDTLGVPASLVVYEGEGHGIRLPAHTNDIMRRMMAWLDRYNAP
jgi:dipeptidyl aminopeptidase/acylaminoacyl peptidase